jgi:protein-disulfide isomerase
MDVKPNFQVIKKPWYRKTWGIVVIFLSLIVLLIVLIFTLQLANYTKQINLGNISTTDFSKTSQETNTSSTPTVGNDLATLTDPFIGNPDASVVIVEFGDFECPFCGQVFPTVREMQAEFSEQVLFVWRDLPLRDIHPNAQKAAEAGECAHEQGKFWPYHDKLFINQHFLAVSDLKSYAQQIGLEVKQFDLCLDSGKYTDEVNEDLQAALAAGAQGTPTFIINDQLVSGVIPRETFRQVILQLLAEN